MDSQALEGKTPPAPAGYPRGLGPPAVTTVSNAPLCLGRSSAKPHLRGPPSPGTSHSGWSPAEVCSCWGQRQSSSRRFLQPLSCPGLLAQEHRALTSSHLASLTVTLRGRLQRAWQGMHMPWLQNIACPNCLPKAGRVQGSAGCTGNAQLGYEHLGTVAQGRKAPGLALGKAAGGFPPVSCCKVI